MMHCKPKGKHPTYHQTHSSNPTSVRAFSVSYMLISIPSNILMTWGTSISRMGSDQICYKRNHYDPFLIDETRDHNPGLPSNPGFCFWTWFGRWSADKTHSVKCIGFIDGVNVGISIVCAVFTVIKSKISLCRTDCSNKEALSYEIEKPKECSWSSNNLEPSLAPLQTLDQIRLERLRIDVLFREYLVNFLNNILPNMLTLHFILTF